MRLPNLHNASDIFMAKNKSLCDILEVLDLAKIETAIQLTT